ncbi:F-box/LRR-repeat protein [Acrasis kona]|uniref:F-box/LRR-repeat protein n=1 Tax=Acrasis kona TaxID=1008807 RepID=A0AAW2ZK58_9EUKA
MLQEVSCLMQNKRRTILKDYLDNIKNSNEKQNIFNVDFRKAQKNITDDIAVKFVDARVIDASSCDLLTIVFFQNAFKHLHTLRIDYCQQIIINDEAIKKLPRTLTCLSMSYCFGFQISDEAFKYLPSGLTKLYLCGLKQGSLTHKVLHNLPEGLHTLDVRNCGKNILTEHAFTRLPLQLHNLHTILYNSNIQLRQDINQCLPYNLRVLDINVYVQKPTISYNFFNDLLTNLPCLHALKIYGKDLDLTHICLPSNLLKLDVALCEIGKSVNSLIEHLPNKLHVLDISYNKQMTDNLFRFLPPNLCVLIMRGCKQRCITNQMFDYLPQGLHTLDISYCRQSTITDSGLCNLPRNLRKLIMNKCDQSGITNVTFQNLPKNLKILQMANCNRRTVTCDIFNHLSTKISLTLGYNENKRIKFAKMCGFNVEVTDINRPCVHHM